MAGGHGVSSWASGRNHGAGGRIRNRPVLYWLLGLMLAIPVPALASHSALGTYVDSSSRVPFPLQSKLSEDVEWVDVDRDGDLDIWVALGTANGIGAADLLFTNTGGGNFAAATSLRIRDDSADVGFGDVDRDGDLDALVANIGRETLFINNAGRFRAEPTRIPAGKPDALDDISIAAEFADVDGDGDLDIGVANERPGTAGSQNFLWINDGTGRFVDETALRIPTRLDQSSGLAFGDIDADGDVDFIVVNNPQNFVMINNGAGVFTDETATRYPTVSAAGRHGVLADVDLDGDLDFYLATGRAQADRLFLNDLGVFTDVTATHMPGVIDSTVDAELVDLDRDGDLDVYAANVGTTVGDPTFHNFTGEQDRIYENDGTGRFTDITSGHLPSVVDATFGASAGDADGDGDLDIVASNGKKQALRLYLQSTP
jgi:VCBS repeat protein